MPQSSAVIIQEMKKLCAGFIFKKKIAAESTIMKTFE